MKRERRGGERRHSDGALIRIRRAAMSIMHICFHAGSGIYPLLIHSIVEHIEY